tara:strand:+ start:309 stop:437 length:129 start_codon:yes stop_codon:yes gene_type:complete
MFSMRKRETGDQPDLFLLRIISLVGFGFGFGIFACGMWRLIP